MDNIRKLAYSYLLHRVLVEIRLYSSLSNRIKWWNPLQWRELYTQMKRINRLSDAFHNLPNFIFEEDGNFNEEEYWLFVEGYEKQYPSKEGSYYETYISKLND